MKRFVWRLHRVCVSFFFIGPSSSPRLKLRVFLFQMIKNTKRRNRNSGASIKFSRWVFEVSICSPLVVFQWLICLVMFLFWGSTSKNHHNIPLIAAENMMLSGISIFMWLQHQFEHEILQTFVSKPIRLYYRIIIDFLLWTVSIISDLFFITFTVLISSFHHY